jgi:hypothetical protein
MQMGVGGKNGQRACQKHEPSDFPISVGGTGPDVSRRGGQREGWPEDRNSTELSQ